MDKIFSSLLSKRNYIGRLGGKIISHGLSGKNYLECANYFGLVKLFSISTLSWANLMVKMVSWVKR